MGTDKFGTRSRVTISLTRSSLLRASIVWAMMLLPAAGGCASITKGPVLLRVCPDRAAIMWETSAPGPGKICYGTGLILSKCVDSTAGGESNKKTSVIRKVWLQDLEPGQTYKYRVAAGGALSEIYEFRTPALDANEVTFVVYGDSRTNADIHRKLIELMKTRKVDFAVHTGDLVTNGDRYEQWEPQFFAPVKGLAETIPIYIAKGNHEGNAGNFEKLLIPPKQGNDFSFNYGPVHYLCIDNVSKGVKSEELLRLIAEDARNSRAQWKFVSYHVPSVNFGGHWSDWGRPDALPILAKAGIDFVITGHSHQYERFWPVTPPGGTDGSYVTYMTAGGGGASLYDIQPALYHAQAKKIHHFCLFHIKGSQLTMDTIDVNGNIIDHLEISKSDGRLNKQYLWTAVPMEAVQLHQSLHAVLTEPLPTKPEKNKPFTISLKFAVPALSSLAKITFTLRCEDGMYELGEPQTLTIGQEAETIEIKLTATPLVDVQVPKDSRARPRPISPALWAECRYEIGRVQEALSEPIMAKP